MNLLKYSNGWGHLIMSLASMAAGIFLITRGGEMAAYGVGLVGLVTSAWFVSGAAKQVATEVTSNQTTAAIQIAAQPITPAPTPPGGNV